MFTINNLSACYIDGEWHPFAECPKLQIFDPYTGTLIGTVPDVGSHGTLLAIDAAAKSFPVWKNVAAVERGKILRAAASLCRDNQNELAQLLTREQGKPISQARSEIAYGAAYLDWFAEEARRTYGTVIPSPNPKQKLTVTKEPIGVCAAITPWNFPNAMIARKAAAALAAGCTMIVKPAPETPFSALALARILELAGLPAGVFNVITGEAEIIGNVFAESAQVKKITFTGSTEVGKIIFAQSAKTVKRLTLELGGNAPFMVFDDADLELAINGLLHAKFRNAGQTCISANRILLHEKIAEEFLQAFKTKLSQLKPGNGFEEDTDIGPLISAEAREKVLHLLNNAKSQGASIYYENTAADRGLILGPRIVCGITESMNLWHQEIFGPIAACTTFYDDDSAIRLANDTVHGLAAYFYTKCIKRAKRIADELQYGMIGINTTVLSMVEAPFGGVKESGFGREGSHYGIDDYLNLKFTAIGTD